MAAIDTRFVEIYETYHDHVRAYCRRRTLVDVVDDAVAETFAVAWRKMDEVPGEPDTLPWLYGVAYRVLASEWRGLMRRRRFEDRWASFGVLRPEQPDDVIVMRDEWTQVLIAAARLKQTDREILRLSLWEELTHAEIGIVLNLRTDAVRQRLSRARGNLTREFVRLESRNARHTRTHEGSA